MSEIANSNHAREQMHSAWHISLISSEQGEKQGANAYLRDIYDDGVLVRLQARSE